MRRLARRLRHDASGAVAPVIAVSLFALVGAAGLAFDYSRLASLDTELQDAADHAALAAATQLDGRTGARTRATAAAQGLVANLTLFANDGGTRGISVPTVTFYQDKAQASAATGDGDAKFVEVTVGTRRAFYALTPVVAAFNSQPIAARALAGLGSAICKVPPLMICNPQETGANKGFDASTLVGAGIRLTEVGNGAGTWTPGNFGYLQTGAGSSGAAGLREALGWLTPSGDCQPITGVQTKPGATTSATDALNTRFDIYDNGQSCPSGGTCPPSANTVKDLVRKTSGSNNCAMATGKGNAGWQQSSTPYEPKTNAALTSGFPDAMGYPRDICHAISSNGSCAGDRIGDKTWDRNAYFYVNYGSAFNWQAAMTAAGYNPATVTRYQVYQWELSSAQSKIGTPRSIGGGLYAYGAPICWAGAPAGGITPAATSVDRRRISAAVVNCQQNTVNGSSRNVPVVSWIDLFLVEPSANRKYTNAGDIYGEIIGETISAQSGATSGQIVRKDAPYLVK